MEDNSAPGSTELSTDDLDSSLADLTAGIKQTAQAPQVTQPPKPESTSPDPNNLVDQLAKVQDLQAKLGGIKAAAGNLDRPKREPPPVPYEEEIVNARIDGIRGMLDSQDAQGRRIEDMASQILADHSRPDERVTPEVVLPAEPELPLDREATDDSNLPEFLRTLRFPREAGNEPGERARAIQPRPLPRVVHRPTDIPESVESTTESAIRPERPLDEWAIVEQQIAEDIANNRFPEGVSYDEEIERRLREAGVSEDQIDERCWTVHQITVRMEREEEAVWALQNYDRNSMITDDSVRRALQYASFFPEEINNELIQDVGHRALNERRVQAGITTPLPPLDKEADQPESTGTPPLDQVDAEIDRALEDLDQEPGAVTTTEVPLTPEAVELINNVDHGGGVPAFISRRLENIANENGIIISGSDTPNEVINRLRARQGAPAGTTTGDTSPLPRIDVPRTSPPIPAREPENPPAQERRGGAGGFLGGLFGRRNRGTGEVPPPPVVPPPPIPPTVAGSGGEIDGLNPVDRLDSILEQWTAYRDSSTGARGRLDLPAWAERYLNDKTGSEIYDLPAKEGQRKEDALNRDKRIQNEVKTRYKGVHHILNELPANKRTEYLGKLKALLYDKDYQGIVNYQESTGQPPIEQTGNPYGKKAFADNLTLLNQLSTKEAEKQLLKDVGLQKRKSDVQRAIAEYLNQMDFFTSNTPTKEWLDKLPSQFRTQILSRLREMGDFQGSRWVFNDGVPEPWRNFYETYFNRLQDLVRKPGDPWDDVRKSLPDTAPITPPAPIQPPPPLPRVPRAPEHVPTPENRQGSILSQRDIDALLAALPPESPSSELDQSLTRFLDVVGDRSYQELEQERENDADQEFRKQLFQSEMDLMSQIRQMDPVVVASILLDRLPGDLLDEICDFLEQEIPDRVGEYYSAINNEIASRASSGVSAPTEVAPTETERNEALQIIGQSIERINELGDYNPDNSEIGDEDIMAYINYVSIIFDTIHTLNLSASELAPLLNSLLPSNLTRLMTTLSHGLPNDRYREIYDVIRPELRYGFPIP